MLIKHKMLENCIKSFFQKHLIHYKCISNFSLIIICNVCPASCVIIFKKRASSVDYCNKPFSSHLVDMATVANHFKLWLYGVCFSS